MSSSYSALLLWIAIALSMMLSVVHSQNDTNDTVTPSPISSQTTTGFFTTDPINFNLSFLPTPSPTKRPTPMPTNKPTNAPTEAIPEGLAQLFSLILKLFGIDQAWVDANTETLIQICCAATGADDCGSDTQVAIGALEDVSNSATRRRLLANGVSVQFLITMKNPVSVVNIRSAVSSGAFIEEFTTSVSDNFENVDVSQNMTFTDEGQGDGDEFLGKEEPTFAELIASPYILLGVVCIVVGTIWLLFLRSNIENKYPSYLAQPAISTVPQSVEMVPQTSAASAEPVETVMDDGESDRDNANEPERKLTNKQELEAAWNDSDAEASGDDPDETRL